MILTTFNEPFEEISIAEAGAWSRDGFGEHFSPRFYQAEQRRNRVLHSHPMRGKTRIAVVMAHVIIVNMYVTYDNITL
jgi:hypothetical protein